MASFFAVQQIPFFRLLLQLFCIDLLSLLQSAVNFQGFSFINYGATITNSQFEECSFKIVCQDLLSLPFQVVEKFNQGSKKRDGKWEQTMKEKESSDFCKQTNSPFFCRLNWLLLLLNTLIYRLIDSAQKTIALFVQKRREEGYCSWSWSWNRLKEVIVNVPSVNLTTSEEDEEKDFEIKSLRKGWFQIH